MTAGRRTEAQPVIRRWQFSLGNLLRGMTVVGLVLLSGVKSGPLIAATVLGLGIAVVLTLHAIWDRQPRWLFGAAMALVLGIIPNWLAANSPCEGETSTCDECGVLRSYASRCGWTTVDKITETDCSRWVARLVPAAHVHHWTCCSVYYRSR